MLPWSAPAFRQDRRGRRERLSSRTCRSGEEPRFLVGVQRSELRHLEEILDLSVASEVLAGPLCESIERDHVWPALPRETGQSLAAKPPLPITTVGEHEIALVGVPI